MFFFLISALSASNKPILFIAGHGGNNVYATIKDPMKFPECPNDLINHFRFWPANDTFIKQYPDCMGKLLRCELNQETQTIQHIQGLQVDYEPFGDLTSLPFHAKIVEYLTTEKQYIKNKNLFGLPYDWILFYAGLPPTFFSEVREFIEKVYHMNNETKVVLIGHSLGTHFIRRLIEQTIKDTNETAANDWFDQYVDSCIFLAPAFTGCFNSFNMVVKGIFSTLDYNKNIEISSMQMPSLHILFENYKVFKGKVIFQNVLENNKFKNYTVDKVMDYLYSSNRMNKEGKEIYEKFTEDSLKDFPSKLPKSIRSFIIYNSGIPTPGAFDVQNNFSFINETGDGFCIAGGPEYACKNWDNIECFDLKKNEERFSHADMLNEKEFIDQLWKYLTNKPGEEKEKLKFWMAFGLIMMTLSCTQMIFYIILAMKIKNNKMNDTIPLV